MPLGLTQLQVVNRALVEIAQAAPLASGTVATNFDGTARGVQAATLYPGAVATLLRNQDYEFCRAATILTPTGKTPPLQWADEYIYPLDCERLRQVAPMSWPALDPQPVRWDVGLSVFVGPILTATLGVGGSTYAVGDTGIVNGVLLGPPATYQVLTVSSTHVVTFSIASNGGVYTLGATLATTPGGAQPGSGTGFTVTVAAITPARVIWTSVASAGLIYSTNAVTEYDMDEMYVEQLVRYLGSLLAMPVAGRPDFSKEMLDIAGKMGIAGKDRDS